MNHKHKDLINQQNRNFRSRSVLQVGKEPDYIRVFEDLSKMTVSKN